MRLVYHIVGLFVGLVSIYTRPNQKWQ